MGDLGLTADSIFPGVPGSPSREQAAADMGKNDGSIAAQAAGEAQVRAAEIGTEELRRQFDITQGNLAPFIQAGLSMLPSILQGSSAEGLDARLGAIMGTDAFQNLRGERMTSLQNQLSAGGLTRSGAALREAANIPADLALALDETLFGRQQNLLGSGQNAAAGLGSLGYNTSNSIAGLQSDAGSAMANSILMGQQADAATRSQNMQIGATALAAMFFSDERLKENMQVVGSVGDLNVYEWDWKPEVKGIIGTDMTIGFSAQEVEEKYPEYIVEIHGFKAINYPGLLERLQ